MNKKISLVVALLAILVVGFAYNQANRFWWSTPKVDAQTVDVRVEEGATLASLTPTLVDDGLVNGFWFRVFTKLSGATKILPGNYTISRGASYASIFATLGAGSESDVTLTIPEGFTLAQIGARVEAMFPNISADDWTAATGINAALANDSFVVAAGKPAGVDLEGYLFPDTYRFVPNATAEVIAKKMIDTMANKVQTVRLANVVGEGKTLANIHEAITLASIIEKEVRQPSTMANVADVFLKRIAIGMALQSDVTVYYAKGGGDADISINDTKIDSPYNTYKHAGLPPGPISSPGLNALSAVASPASNPYYYFLTTPLGDVYYAKTLDEHNANKARYLK